MKLLKTPLTLLALLILSACAENFQIDIDTGKREIVLNSILDATQDTIWANLSWSVPIDEPFEYNVIDDATIVLEKDDDSLGVFQYAGEGRYFFSDTPCGKSTYTIIAHIEEKTVYGKTFVPPTPEATIELENRIHGQYAVLLNSYSNSDYTLWFAASDFSCIGGVEGLRLVLGLHGDNILYDDFNRLASTRYGFIYDYSYYIRILETPSAITEPLKFAIGTLSRNEIHEITVFAADKNLDKYIKSSILARNYEMFLEETPVVTKPTLIHSNVQGGMGLVGSINKTTSVFTYN